MFHIAKENNYPTIIFYCGIQTTKEMDVYGVTYCYSHSASIGGWSERNDKCKECWNHPEYQMWLLVHG
jgi:hypothetical protein